MPLYAFFFLALFVGHTALFAELSDKLSDANRHYQQGLLAESYLEREKAFNQALTLYWEVIDGTAAPSSELYQAIADCFFQLNAYAWSILYNEKALEITPRNPLIYRHLALSREHLGLKDEPKRFPLWDKWHLKSWWSFGERLEWFFWLFAFTTCVLSTHIWFSNPWLKKAAIILISISLLLLFNLLLTFYFSPIEGILISSTGYYREPDVRQPQLTLLPKRAGTKMYILDVQQQGSWLKVKDAEGLIGYIPAKAIRMI